MSLPHWYTIPKNGRRPQSLKKIIFKEEWPMVLDNQVSTRRGKEKGIFIDYLFIVLLEGKCEKDFNFFSVLILTILCTKQKVICQ